MPETLNIFPKFLVNPKSMANGGANVLFAKQAILRCGGIHVHDIVYIIDHTVGQVMDFWGNDSNQVAARCRMLLPTTIVTQWAFNPAPLVRIIEATSIVDTLSWAQLGGNRIRIAMPFRVVLPNSVL